MSQEIPADHIAKKSVVYQLPDAEAVTIRQNVEYPSAAGGVLTMDVYSPSDAQSRA